MSKTLLLFDIDGTLLDTGGAGAAALLDAAEAILEVRREELPPLDLAGATDGGVIRQLFTDAKLEFGEARANAFRDHYLERLRIRLHQGDFPGRLLAGVTELLPRLREAADVFAIGLLTGNLRRGAQLKLERFNIHHHFADGGFGDDGVHRNELGPVAVLRMEQAVARRFSPEQVIVIGDTPKDVACAQAMGARCLAVATGKFTRPELEPLSPWKVMDDLSDVESVLGTLLS